MKHSKIREVRPRITFFNTRTASLLVRVRPKESLYESLETPHWCWRFLLYLRTICKPGPEAAILKERTIKITAATIINAERAINAVAIIIAKERVMKAITITITLLIIAIALPAIY
jgi:hypothetical protein